MQVLEVDEADGRNSAKHQGSTYFSAEINTPHSKDSPRLLQPGREE